MINQLYGIDFGDGNALLGSILEQTINTGTQVITDSQTGDIYANTVNIAAASPGGMFRTADIRLAKSKVPLDSGACISWVASPPPLGGITMFTNRYTCGGSQATQTVNASALIKEGVITPRRLTVDHTGNVTMQYQIMAVRPADDTPSVIITTGVALPALAESQQRWTMHSGQLGGTAIPKGMRSIEIDFGNVIATEGADSDVEPQAVAIRSHQPRITTTSLYSQALIALMGNDATAGILDGLALTHADSFLIFRGRRNTAAAEAIRITFAGLAVMQNVFQSQGKNTGTNQIVCHLEHDGSNVPILWNLDYTIP